MSQIQDPRDYLWETKYRPRTLNDCILPVVMKKTAAQIIESGEMPNALFSSSSPGTGKTTLARVLGQDMDYSVLFINASEDSGIDTVRTRIRQFASTLDLTGRPKLVILDEADGFSDNSQKALKGFIEEFAATCRFILTANSANRIIKPIRSRLNHYEFMVPEAERNTIMKQMIKRCLKICETEQVKVSSPKVIAELVKKHFPDNRQVLVELQNYSRQGEIDEGILGQVVGGNPVDEIIVNLKARNFKELRGLAAHASDDYAGLIRGLYTRGLQHVDGANKGDYILCLGESMKHANHVADIEIHVAALFVELMTQVKWNG